jgi:hypothetical protein
VAAVSTEGALVTAQRLGIGGAMSVPPSSLGALEAFAAAGAREPGTAGDASTLGLLDGRSIHVVTVSDRSFWRAQLGDRGLAELLTELASGLEVPAATLAWPVLVVAECDPAAISEAWAGLAAVAGKGAPNIVILSPRPESLERGVLDAVYESLLGPAPPKVPAEPMSPQPIHELPHGRRVGWWRLENEPVPDDEGWLATPVEVTPMGCRWKLEGAGVSGTVAEVLGGHEVAGVEEAIAVRVPGWTCRNLRSGSPAGLLVGRIADAASRRGLPLWIPGVDQEGLRFVLGLPGVIWVDGPAVPHPDKS